MAGVKGAGRKSYDPRCGIQDYRCWNREAHDPHLWSVGQQRYRCMGRFGDEAALGPMAEWADRALAAESSLDRARQMLVNMGIPRDTVVTWTAPDHWVG